MENDSLKKEPRAFNKYTGKKARNIAWVGDYIRDGLEQKRKRGHIFGRLDLEASKLLLLIEGVQVYRRTAKADKRQKPEVKRAIKPINLPRILKEFTASNGGG